MKMEQHVFSNCEAHLCPEDILIGVGDCGDSPLSQNQVALQQPVKKQTRQWAAWTRQEEESFFSALRQVGKNFEKITCRVQSKNKDQVRHYYYRLVRRMNKLLGPELCLDAKNSKDTNAAMLRWWSLLEKYSCKASKLHLKPRRFKIFIETLEHQLLKDRKKNMRKRRSQVENCVSTAAATVSSQGRALVHDTRAVEVVLVDSQNMQKLGPVKGSPFRRNLNIGINRGNNKGDSSTLKTLRPRQKSGAVSMAAYKRWEKAAIAGVSLVADAAEHLERTVTEADHVAIALGKKGFDHVGEDNPTFTTPKNLFIEKNIQSSMKLKLQLFPIDDGTRRALELDNYNPYLELTLSMRKKISSVVEHLNRKWGNSSVALGELMLFPFCILRENLVDHQRWTQDSVLSAADVYASIGRPPLFRLRYGWVSNSEPPSTKVQASSSRIMDEHNGNMNEQIVDLISIATPPTDHQPGKLMDHCEDQLVSVTKTAASVPSSAYDVPNKVGCSDAYSGKSLQESPGRPSSWLLRDTDKVAIMRQMEYVDDRRSTKSIALSTGEWADSLTNISVGDLLSEAGHDMDANCGGPPQSGSAQCSQQIPFSCDSFDAAIAAHIYRNHSKNGFQPALASHVSSIWDAEETCDAFSFQKNNFFLKDDQGAVQSTSPEAHKELGRSEGCSAAVEELPEVDGPMDDNSAREDPVDDDPAHADPVNDDLARLDPMDACQSDSNVMENSVKDLTGLTDIYWPDSLGPLDLDIPSCKYHSEDLILSDSLSGLNRLIASSLDAFQNCTFFSLEKKESASTVEARDTPSFSDYKVGGEG